MSEPRAQSGMSAGRLSITDAELFDRLAWFTHVRWAFGALCLLVFLVAWYVVGLRLRSPEGRLTMAPAVEVVLALFVYNAVFTFVGHIARSRERITRRWIVLVALTQIFCDLVAITLLVHFTGGVENFFVVLILVPIVIVTELLPQPLAYAAAAVAAGLLNALAWLELAGMVPHIRVELAGAIPNGEPGMHADTLYVLHVTAALTVTIFAMVAVASTIANRLRARETELEDAYHRLHEIDQAKGFFMRKAEHEMRAPLSAIHSILQTIPQVAPDLSEDARRLIERGKLRTEAMLVLVNDLLKLSRLRSAAPGSDLVAVQLADIVRNTAELMAPRAEGSGLQFEWDSDSVTLLGDEEMLRELVTNLLANAIQYTPRGGRIDVRLVREDSSAVLTVADTGIGISPAAAERLFEEFYRAPEAKKAFTDGTGVGLSIVRRVVEIHGGEISVSAREGGGTVFRVRLPLDLRAETRE